jgi:hypothetical protein
LVPPTDLVLQNYVHHCLTVNYSFAMHDLKKTIGSVARPVQQC